MSTFTDLEKDAVSVDGFVNENALIVTRRNGPKPSWQYIVDQVYAQLGYAVAGSFVDGFTYTGIRQVGVDASGNTWIYTGGEKNLPHAVPAGTVPSAPNYFQVSVNSADNVVLDNGENLQQAIDRLNLENDAIQEYIDGQQFENIDAVKSYANLSVLIGQRIQTKEYHAGTGYGGASYDVVASSDVTPNGIDIIQGVTDSGAAISLVINSCNYITQAGAKGSLSAVSDNLVEDSYESIQRAFDIFNHVVIDRGFKFKTSKQINQVRDNISLTVKGRLFGSFGSQPQSLIVYSKTPPAINSQAYIEPSGTISEFNIHFDGGTLDWGVNDTDFVYTYDVVENYWVYHTLYIDRGLNFNITGGGKLLNALIGNLQMRRPKDFIVDANLTLDGNVYDNSASITSSPETTGFGNGLDSEIWNNGLVKGLRIYNADSYGINTFNTINVSFEDVKTIKCDKGFSAENTFDRTVPSRTNFKSCQALNCTGVSSNVNTDRSGTGFVIESTGTVVDSACLVLGGDVGVRVVQATGVLLDLSIEDTTNEGVRISQNGVVSPEVVFGSSFKAEGTGSHGISTRGANILSFSDGVQISNNQGYAIYPSNSGGSNYNQGEGVFSVGNILISGNLGIRTNDMKVVKIDSPLLFVNNTKGIDIRETGTVKINNVDVYDGGDGLLASSGVAISIESSVINSFVWGLSTDANARISNLASNKYGMGQEGDGDSAATTVEALVNDFNDLLSKIRRAGIINQ